MTQHTRCYAGPTAADLAHIPRELTARPQWVLWQGADRIDTKTGEITGLEKIPINPHTLHKASTTNPQTWGTFDLCVTTLPVALEEWEHNDPASYRGGGIGYVFAADDPYAGIDLDHCIDPDTHKIGAWAQAYVADLRSYTEITPSHTGVHILVQSTLPPGGRKKGGVELYDQARFFTMTGLHVARTPPTIEPRQEAVARLHRQVFGVSVPSPQQVRSPAPALLEDTAILDKARAAKNGAKFAALWEGDTSHHDHDESSADLALCEILAFWTQDPTQIDRLFRHSGLMRDKWDAQRGEQTYGTRTIAKALALQRERYHGDDRHRRAIPAMSQAPAPDPDDPEERPGAIVHHVLPDYLAQHPDPRVRQYWQRVYRRTAHLKAQLYAQGVLP